MRAKPAFFRLLALAIALAFTACRYPRTEVLVEVSTDIPYGPGRSIEHVEIEVRSADGAQTVRVRQDYAVGNGAGLTPLPLSFGLHPLPGSEGALVRVRACGAGGCNARLGVVVERRAAVQFVADHTRVLRLELSRDCAYVACAEGQACDPDLGYCGPATTQTLPADDDADAGPAPVRTQLSVGGGYSCEKGADGAVRCWGGAGGLLNYERVPTARATPGLPSGVLGLGAVEQVDVGDGHACAVDAGGAVWCWGDNSHGQLGDGTTMPRPGAVQVNGLTDVAEVRAGQGFSCVRMRDGTVRCWGRMEMVAAPGIAVRMHPLVEQLAPAQMPGFTDIVQLAVGTGFLCGLQASGAVLCAGSGSSGQMGNGGTAVQIVAAAVHGVTDAAELTVGSAFACVRRRGGTVLCWGNNDNGELGDGSTVARFEPVPVLGLEGVAAIEAGRFHACARLNTGLAACWGRNDSGQLGDGTQIDRSVPVAVSGISGVAELRAGAEHTCARLAVATPGGSGNTGDAGTTARSGAVQCWGSDAAGELGSGRALWDGIPARVGDEQDQFTSVSASGPQTCALRNGVAACWGLRVAGNQVGRQQLILPEGPRAAVSLPVAQADLGGPVVSVDSSGSAECAVLASGNVFCLGDNREFELGRTEPVRSGTPLEVPGLSDIVQVANGETHVCALARDGTVFCWGSNDAGQLGTGEIGSGRATPARVAGLANVEQIAAGVNATCARTRDGAVYCWGDNSHGQLGAGAMFTISRTPVRVAGISNALEISVSDVHACARVATGEVECWGQGSFGELGTLHLEACPNFPQNICLTAPVALDALHGRAIAIGTGPLDSCAVLEDHTAWCWGLNNAGQLGNGQQAGPTPAPQRVAGDYAFDAISPGDFHTCARTTDGKMLCWGSGIDGALGQPVPPPVALSPLGVELDGPVAALQTGTNHTCAILQSGALYCWGDNFFGQAGDGTINPTGPVDVVGLTDANTLSSGDFATCARRQDGTVACWGLNAVGELGDGTQIDRVTPAVVPGLANVRQIDFNGGDVCAVAVDGTVACWGENWAGQLGPDGPSSGSSSPVTVPGLLDVAEVRTSDGTSCAREADGSVWCWGANFDGEFGDGSTAQTRAIPGRVPGLPPVVGLTMFNLNVCAWTADGAVYCWGYAGSNLLGRPGPEQCASGPCSRTPVLVAVPGQVQQVDGHDFNACARTIENRESVVYCWGENNAGQLGHGTSTPTPADLPVRVLGLTDVADIGLGSQFACAALRDGTVHCWGANNRFQTGSPPLPGMGGDFALVPIQVAGVQSATSVGLGNNHACAVLSDHTMRCWGGNEIGQLGTGRAQTVFQPNPFVGLNLPGDVQAGFGYACGQTEGRVACWGANALGQLGLPDLGHLDAQPVSITGRVDEISVGLDHTVALVDHEIRAWGNNSSGMLGLGDANVPFSAMPLRVASAWMPERVTAGGRHTCAINGAALGGQVYCWGANDHGQLGMETTEQCPVMPCFPDDCSAQAACSSTPRQLPDLPAATGVSAGGQHTCAWTPDGTVYCWGRNDHGQLGDGTRTDRDAPTRVPGLSNIVSVSAGTDAECVLPSGVTPQCGPSGRDHTCAHDGDGGVWCWGANDRGQSGTPAGGDVLTPVKIAGLGAAVQVAAGGAHSCARTRDNALWCWGSDGYGQLGAGATLVRTAPAEVQGL